MNQNNFEMLSGKRKAAQDSVAKSRHRTVPTVIACLRLIACCKGLGGVGLEP